MTHMSHTLLITFLLVKKKEAALTRDNSKMTHTVYAPRFPIEKQEWWWAYLVMVGCYSLVIVCVGVHMFIHVTS